MTSHSKGLLLGFVASVIWGSQYSVARFVFGEAGEILNPYFMSMMKFAFGALALAPLLFWDSGWKKCRQALKNDWKNFIAMALLGAVLEGTLSFCSTKYTTAARSSLLCNMSPIWTVLIAALVSWKKPSGHVFSGMLIGFAGLALALMAHSCDIYSGEGRTCIGDVMAVLSGICWAAYTVFGVKTAKKYGGIPSSFLMLLLATFMMQPCCYSGRCTWLAGVEWKTWLCIAYLGIVATGVALVCWYSALKYVPPESLGGYGYLSASISIVLARLAAHEVFSWLFFVAVVLIMGGVFLMNRSAHGPE